MTFILQRQFRTLQRRITTSRYREWNRSSYDFYPDRVGTWTWRWRSLSSTPPPTKPEAHTETVSNTQLKMKQIQELIDASTKGVGQVIFLNSGTSGRIILAGLAIGDPFLATMATVGTLTATATAIYLPLNPSKRETLVNNGLYSYNGCLIGCASSVFLSSTFSTTSGWVLASTALTITGASSATVVTAILHKVCPPMPQWTYAFNFVMLIALLRIQPFAPKMTNMTTTSEVVDVTSTSTASALDILVSPVTGLSQIFVVESVWTGVGILAAIASYSPGLAFHAIMGSTVGCIMGSLVYNAPMTDVAAGLWGYNAALTCLGVGVFFVPSNQTTALSFTGAMATTAMLGAMQPIFTSTPCLTLPFCLTMSACWLLGTPSSQQSTAVIPGLILAPNPHSPEKNAM